MLHAASATRSPICRRPAGPRTGIKLQVLSKTEVMTFTNGYVPFHLVKARVKPSCKPNCLRTLQRRRRSAFRDCAVQLVVRSSRGSSRRRPTHSISRPCRAVPRCGAHLVATQSPDKRCRVATSLTPTALPMTSRQRMRANKFTSRQPTSAAATSCFGKSLLTISDETVERNKLE